MSDRDAITRSQAIVAHELAHIRRRDHYVMWLELLAGLVWWWNPLFWFIRRRLHDAREMACDAMALRGVNDARHEYAALLLEISAADKPSFSAAPAFGAGKLFSGSLQRRLEMVFNERASGRTSAGGWAIVLVAAVLVIPRWSLGQDTPPATPTPVAEDTVPGEVAPPAAGVTPAVPSAPTAPRAPGQPVPILTIPSGKNVPGEEAPRVAQELQIAGGGTLRLRLNDNGQLLLQVAQGDNVSEHIIDLQSVLWQRTDPNSLPPGRDPVGLPRLAPPPIRTPSPPGVRLPQPANLPPQIVERRAEQRPAHNLELLRVDCDLAEINVKKKRVMLEELQKLRARVPDSVSDKDVLIAELEMQEAELQRRRCELLLKGEEQRQAQPQLQSR